MEDRTVARFLVPVITAYIRGLQDKGAGGECVRMLLSDLEELDREWIQDDRQSTGNCRGRKYCLTGVSFTPHTADLNMSEQYGGKKLRNGDPGARICASDIGLNISNRGGWGHPRS